MWATQESWVWIPENNWKDRKWLQCFSLNCSNQWLRFPAEWKDSVILMKGGGHMNEYTSVLMMDKALCCTGMFSFCGWKDMFAEVFQKPGWEKGLVTLREDSVLQWKAKQTLIRLCAFKRARIAGLQDLISFTKWINRRKGWVQKKLVYVGGARAVKRLNRGNRSQSWCEIQPAESEKERHKDRNLL